MDNIILYTIDCPACLILEKKLDNQQITYTKTQVDSTNPMGFTSFPVLSVNGENLGLRDANDWIKKRGDN